jgi:cyclic beta-1,2-glucan synthetase
MRAELFSISQLEGHARALAGSREISQTRVEDRLLARLADNARALRDAYALVTEAVTRGCRITPAAEWFIDNYYLIEEQVLTARRHLPRGYSRELPRLTNGPTAGDPRVYDIAIELISHSHGRVDADSLRGFVGAYQEVCPLRLGELWAIPIMLRLALLENLRRLAACVAAGRSERERAGEWVDRMLAVAAREPAKVVLVLADLVEADPPLTDSFVAEMAARLQGQGPAFAFVGTWIEQRLAERGRTVEHVFQQVSQSQAADQVAIANSIGSLRFLGATDWRDFVEEMSGVEQTLREDPAGVYDAMDFGTRDMYRHVVEETARRSRTDERAVARAAIDLANSAAGGRAAHVGYYLVDEGRDRLERAVHMRRGPFLAVRRWMRRGRVLVYGGAIAAFTAGASAMLALAAPSDGMPRWARIILGFLLVLATSELAVALVHWAATLLVRPRALPRLDFAQGIPSAQRTLVAVPSMLTDAAEIDGLLESLEVRYLANADPQLAFALVTDFRDADQATIDGDEALLRHVREGIEALNARHAEGRTAPFYLLHRARRHNPREGVWMGWERKRGKLEELNDALRGDASGFDTVVGNMAYLQAVKYVIALDSDTRLPRDGARELAATMAHPLIHPRVDERLGRVTEGYGILQPRVAITMESARSSRFASLYGGEPGIDPYTRAVSDVYQDVFDEGSFVGKGIYDVDALRLVLGKRLPENRVLSHDLLEGAYARSGLTSDVLLFEDYPATYGSDASRRYRWMRGDWQIAAWIGRRVPGGEGGRVANPISWLSRWKILDNLRRSLVPPALFALLVGGWLVPNGAWFSSAVVAAILILPGLIAAAADLTRRPTERPVHRHGREIATTFGRQMLRQGVSLACLPFDAYLSATAILRTTIRVVITRRRLLEWRTAADAQRGTRKDLAGAYRFMASAPVCGTVIAAGLALYQPDALLVASPILLLWALAPALVWWMSLVRVAEPHHLAAEDVRFLRALARRTWRFFETFVDAADHHLPPDNFQEDPPRGAAHRTSPTNIGLTLTANLAAYDFGYLTVADVIERSALTLGGLEQLQRHRGHFYNWYDTRSLEPLRPMYVSTVDSGNLAGHLLTLAAGLQELARHPVFPGQIFSGLVDALEVLADVARATPEVVAASQELASDLSSPPGGLAAARDRLEQLVGPSGARLRDEALRCDEESRWWAQAFFAQCRNALAELDRVAPWVELDTRAIAPGELCDAVSRLDQAPTLTDVAALEHTLVPVLEAALADATRGAPADAQFDLLTRLRDAARRASAHASARLNEIERLAARCKELAALDYEFLYDRDRHLLSIGYNAVDHRLDASFYDLLASEARLASFVAIAQRQLPQEHWFSLGRPLTSTAGKPALLSWSGSMFEYLMPLLVMPTYDRTILDQTYRSVVDRQIEYGRERGVAWGVSESGYNKTDAQLNYQYRAFGVPGLGFKRGLAEDLVIAPYASAMALMIAPEAACYNLRRLVREGQLGPYGLYEAIDYTPARLPRGKERVTVRSYMAHHQGMAFLAAAYVLLERPMQRRFESDPALRATNLLLQERVPRVPSIDPHPAEVSAMNEPRGAGEQTLRVFSRADTPAPAVQLLSNGAYHVAVTNAGGGYSRWRNLAVTRWHEDPTCDGWGSFCYLRDVTTGAGAFWSVAHQPTRQPASQYEAVFSLGRAEFRRRDRDIDTHVEISVSPEDDIELRRISLTNLGADARSIELTSFAEVVLAPAAADAAHPAFSNLFVQTELVPSRQAILCTRRPRSGGERPPWMLHLMTVQGTQVGTTSYETGRGEFIGRGRSAADPAAMHRPSLHNSEGAVLDPVVAIRNTVLIQPDETVSIHLVTGVSETREGAVALVEKYSDRHSADRVFGLSWTHNQVLLHRLDATEADTQLYERLVSNVLYANPAMRAPGSVIARNRRSQSGLWAYSISGDLPIVLARIADRANLSLVRQMVQAHAYWQGKGVAADLFIWNEDPSGYRQVLHEDILGVIDALREGNELDKPGGIFLRRSDQLSEEDKVLVQTVARLIVSDADGSLADQVNRRPPVTVAVPSLGVGREPAVAERGAAAIARPDGLTGWNGSGGFTNDGREYVIVTGTEARTPAPWVNVLANPYFGTVVSESGGAYTWCENAHSYRLTPWYGDPVSDPSGEAFYLRDEEDGAFWSPTPLPAGGAGPYTTRHGFGYSVFEHAERGIASEMHTYVATDAPLKFMVVKVKNQSGRPRRLSLTGLFELVLGEHRPINAPHVVTEVDPVSNAVFARNAYSTDFASRVAFLDCSDEHRSISADRREIIGRNGSLARPACMGRGHLSGRVGAGLDPCLAMQAMLPLADGEEREIAFTFGSGRDMDDARMLVHRFRGTRAARTALEAVWAYWNRTLSAIHVQTPDSSLDFLANGWLLYQVLSARLWGRSGYYQSGGAFGFRDQLQDAMALVHAEPALLREQILRAASRQFREGDVQHWWHPPMGRGVRTRISDDYLFLPHAVCRYVAATGDTGVLGEDVPFLEGRRVRPDEDSYYDLPTRSEESAAVYEHCVRAIDHALQFGEHGLPLMGTGDWNDGMNLVGHGGKGESVWLAFFLYDVLVHFAALARARQDGSVADRYTGAAQLLRANIEAHGWDGAWYRRAYFDDGRPLGSAASDECQIDSLPQSWAVLSGAGDPARARQGLDAVDQRLVRRDLGVIQLFDPPFDTSTLEPGYVKGYVPGVRENGGQYTHAAVWAVMAFARSGDVARAWELFDLINPVRHGDNPARLATYKVEPYVAAADVYTTPQHAGRGGWTWYTGSAAWMYRLIVESLLGIRLEVDRLRVEPLMPTAWQGFDVHYRHHNTVYHIHVANVGGGGRDVRRVVCDGVEQEDRAIPLCDDGAEHHAEVDIGGGGA